MLTSRLLIAAWALARPSPSASASTGAPLSAAVTVHTDAGDRLAIADLASGNYEVVGKAGATDPAWSPDGRILVYREGSSVFLMRATERTGRKFFQGIDPSVPAAYAFSPDSKILAVATPTAVEFWSLDSDPPRKVAAAGSKLRMKDLTWSPDGKRVAGCGWNGKEAEASRESIQLFELAAAAATTRALRPMKSCRVLGIRQGKWLAKGSLADRFEEVVAVGDEGKSETLLRVGEYRHADRYLPSADAATLVHEVEDTGESTQIDLAPLSGVGKPRPWLRKWKRLAEYSLSADGRYVLFTQGSADGERKGGDVYLATADGQDPRRVLPSSRRASFSQPLPRPRPQE
jgi:Tol biopolymer transport system component